MGKSAKDVQPSPQTAAAAAQEGPVSSGEAQSSARRLLLLGHLAAVVSHDMRSPLNAIFLHSDIVEEELRQPTSESHVQVGESLAEIKSELHRVHDLMQNYLTLARLPVLSYTVEALGTLLESMASDVRKELQARGFGLHVEGIDDLGQALLHKSSFQRAMRNLFHHTMATMSRGSTLTIRGRQTPAQIVIEVDSPGEGISEAQLASLATPLEAVDLETIDLPLLVTREIIAALNGHLDIQCEAGQGRRFSVTLPGVNTDGNPTH